MLTNIPFFKDIMVVSFSCDHCGYRNNEIENAGVLAEFGHKLTLTVTCKEDLDRDICRGEFATTFIPELGLEVPFNKKGQMSTLEGFLTGFRDDLLMQQPQRKVLLSLLQINNPETAHQIDEFIAKLDKYTKADESILPFHFAIDDPAGNSFIKNPFFPKADDNLKVEKYSRTIEQIRAMGYEPDNADIAVVKEDEDKNKAIREKFSSLKNKEGGITEEKKKEIQALSKELQTTHGKGKYSEKETEKMIEKAVEINKHIHYSAHKMDFTKPIETTDLEGRFI